MTTPATELTRRLDVALAAAREAGQITLEYFRRDDLKVERKSDDSPVTAADRRAEECLRGRIAAAFPDDAILGEELPERPGTSGFRWILDPIDGTKSFIHGVPLYGTLVGLEHAGRARARASSASRPWTKPSMPPSARGRGTSRATSRRGLARVSDADAVGQGPVRHQRSGHLRRRSAAATSTIGFRPPPG